MVKEVIVMIKSYSSGKSYSFDKNVIVMILKYSYGKKL